MGKCKIYCNNPSFAVYFSCMTRRGRKYEGEEIPVKANKVLNIILVAFVLISLRVWHLSVLQYEQRVESSRRPQEKVLVEPARRGTIRDRFNLPLAINKIQYQAAILYSQIAQLPAVSWEMEGGKKIKKYTRREHVARLAKVLGNELEMDPGRIEDLIYSKASFYYYIPYVLKENITERQYARLKMLEGDLAGIAVLKVPKRHYPKGKSGGDVIGYMGAITQEEYEDFLKKIGELKLCLQEYDSATEVELPDGIATVEEARARLVELQDLAYTLNDSVGKGGVEALFEESLRGRIGQKRYVTDAKGNFLQKLPTGREVESGSRVLLTLSSELQEYCEQFLAQNEPIRKVRASSVGGAGRSQTVSKEPWIKGGAIIALDPNTAEVVALASYPRFDPNDFVRAKENRQVLQWFETEEFIGEIWDQKRTIRRERFDPLLQQFYDEEKMMTWQAYQSFILPDSSPVILALEKWGTLEKGCKAISDFQELILLAGRRDAYTVCNTLWKSSEHIPHQRRVRAAIKEAVEENILENELQVQQIKARLDPIFLTLPHNHDKVLFIDLLRLLLSNETMSPKLMEALGKTTLAEHKKNQSAFVNLQEWVRSAAQELFHQTVFTPWREENQKKYLKEMRLAEKQAQKRFQTPYLDLLDAKEKEMFGKFWEEKKWDLFADFLTGRGGGDPFGEVFSGWHSELIKGAHWAVPWREDFFRLASIASSLETPLLLEYLQSMRSFRELNRPLYGRYRFLKKGPEGQTEKHLAQGFYPKYGFGYCRSYGWREAAAPGSVFKLVTACQALCQRYADGKRGMALNPLTITDDYFQSGGQTFVGNTEQGVAIPQNYKGGRLPRSHRAGLGKVDLMRAMEVSSNPYFSLLASDVISSPNDLAEAAKKFGFGAKTGFVLGGERRGLVPQDLDINPTGLYMTAVGQHTLLATPLQISVMLSSLANGGELVVPKVIQMTASSQGVTAFGKKVRQTIALPEVVRQTLLEGMRRVAANISQSSWSLSEMYKDQPGAIADLMELKGDMVGKSSTAESVEQIDMDIVTGINRYNHVWFGAIIFEKQPAPDAGSVSSSVQFSKPELVVVVYLKYGSWGKDAAPVAAQVANKWREIKKKHLLN